MCMHTNPLTNRHSESFNKLVFVLKVPFFTFLTDPRDITLDMPKTFDEHTATIRNDLHLSVVHLLHLPMLQPGMGQFHSGVDCQFQF